MKWKTLQGHYVYARLDNLEARVWRDQIGRFKGGYDWAIYKDKRVLANGAEFTSTKARAQAKLKLQEFTRPISWL